jgi:hypothetical protein
MDDLLNQFGFVLHIAYHLNEHLTTAPNKKGSVEFLRKKLKKFNNNG